MSKRTYLNNTVTLTGESDGALFERTFTIVRIISEGADGVSYEAYHTKSGKGVLKEYYPLDFVLLERDEEGRLGIDSEASGAFNQFRKRKADFIKSYEMLIELRQQTDDKDISSFIPSFELYYGKASSDDYESTVYIWSPEPKLETFESICDEIHKQPDVQPEHKLVTVLTAIDTLTKCICALHSAGIIHRDIKPSNFGFINRQGETLTQAISMFDIDSLCTVWEEQTEIKGTEGYTEPEAEYEECSNQTDIYSIGATLFSAIIVTDETRAANFIFKDQFYKNIRSLVSSSELIQASEANSRPRLRNILSIILEKTLCDRSARYNNCEQLLEDIKEALFYALPAEITRKSRAGEKWELSEASEYLDRNAEKNSYLSILYHLYEYPLYEYLDTDESELNVMLIGLDSYGQKFLDACLQIGQIAGTKLNIGIIGYDEIDKEIYLSERPALKEFFSINVSDNSSDSYGNIIFSAAGPVLRDGNILISNLTDQIQDIWKGKTVHYCFISTGDDKANVMMASVISRRMREADQSFSINYIEEKKSELISVDYCHAISVNKPISNNPFYREVERMAYNTHLVWEKNLNVNSRAVKREFNRDYNHDSCVSSVISLKYKLHTLGLDFSSSGEAVEAAAELADRTYDDRKTELMWIEHRRWVSEKICNGWQRIENLNECITGKTKDEKSRRHICIVKSRPDRLLHDILTDQAKCVSRDNGLSISVKELDDLDWVSWELHCIYERKAQEIRESSPYSNHIIISLRAQAEAAGSISSFNEWFSCVRALWEGDSSKVKLYRGLRDDFLEASSKYDSDNEKILSRQLKLFDDYIAPLRECANFHDLKDEDAEFIENIPFILTYSDKIHLIIPYSLSDNTTDIFNNVSTATLINPAEITYIVSAERPGDVDHFEKQLTSINDYADHKKLKALFNIIILDMCHIGEETDIFSKRLQSIRRVKKVRIADASDTDTETWIRDYFSDLYHKEKEWMIAAEKNPAVKSATNELAGIYDFLPWYVFDSAQMRFTEVSGCDALSYVRKKPFITISDVVLLTSKYYYIMEKPEFFADYDKLWKTYTDNKQAWTDMCEILNSYSHRRDIIAKLRPADIRGGKNPDEYRYIIPIFCYEGASRLIGELIKGGALDSSSRISRYTSDAYEVRIVDYAGQKAGYDSIFSNVYALCIHEALTCEQSTRNREIVITFDNLRVAKLDLSADKFNNVYSILEKLNADGIIAGLVCSGNKVSFTFASGMIKHILESTGRIKELYTYYSFKNCGKYDDVALGNLYHIDRCDALPVRCCIATKGFTCGIEVFSSAVNKTKYIKNAPVVCSEFGINPIIYQSEEIHKKTM